MTDELRGPTAACALVGTFMDVPQVCGEPPESAWHDRQQPEWFKHDFVAHPAAPASEVSDEALADQDNEARALLRRIVDSATLDDSRPFSEAIDDAERYLAALPPSELPAWRLVLSQLESAATARADGYTSMVGVSDESARIPQPRRLVLTPLDAAAFAYPPGVRR